MPPRLDPLAYLPPLLWALNVIASRVAMREISPEWGSFLRFALALPLFLLALRRWPSLKPLGQTLFLALTGVALFNLTLFYGLSLAPASDAAAIGAVYPIATALAYSLYFRKPLGRDLALGLLLSGLGVGLLGLAHARGEGQDRLLGDILLVGAALLWGVYSVGVSLGVRRREALELTAASMLLGSLLLLPMTLREPFPQASGLAWGGLLYTAVGGAFLAFTLWGALLRRYPASQLAPLMNLTPALALLLSILLLGEAPSPLDLPGLALVALGVYLAQFGLKRP